MKDEPVQNGAAVHVLAGVIAMLAAKYLPTLGVTDVQAMTIAGSIFAAVVALWSRFVTRAKVVPMTKVESRLAAAHPAALAALKRPS